MLHSAHQAVASHRPAVVEPRHGGLEYFIAIAKRRLFYLLVPFLVTLVLGFLAVAIQRPMYQAQGKILVRTSSDQQTITDTATQRIQVIQQRIMTPDNLVKIANKFELFSSQQQSSLELLDLLRQRTKITLLDPNVLPVQQGFYQSYLTIAFTISFDYENAETAARVANEFMTLVLSEDARNRTNRAAETTNFLEQETKRLQGAVASIEAQIIAATTLTPPNPIEAERTELAKLKVEFAQKSATYSDAHPEVKALKKRIATLEKTLSQQPEKSQTSAATTDNGLEVLKQRLTLTEADLDEANRKLSMARLSERLEANPRSESLQVLEQPVVPQHPIKPNRPKLFALAFVLALIVGVGTVMAAEALDKSIHTTQELADVVDSRLIVTIPYISTRGEALRKKSLRGVALLALAAIVVALYLGRSIDLSSWADRPWQAQLTHLSR